ncbi:MAG: SH3 domain-containing protein [Mariprofundaceae bacterium]
MGKISLYFISAALLQGCVAISTLSLIPSSVVDGTVYMFTGVKVSLALPAKGIVVAVQQGLHEISLDMNVLEQTDAGYSINMGNEELDGFIDIERETENLSTLYVKVRKGVMRQASIEQAVIRSIREWSGQLSPDVTLDLSTYLPLRRSPDDSSPVVGWYRQGALATLQQSEHKAWLQISLPSGKKAYLQGILGKLNNT